jgi:branched-chain amino acid transport system substrate-binding protein
MIEAMKVADSTSPAKYLPALKAISFQGVTGNVAFDAKGDIKEGAITVYQFKDGGWNPVP